MTGKKRSSQKHSNLESMGFRFIRTDSGECKVLQGTRIKSTVWGTYDSVSKALDVISTMYEV